MSGPLRSVVVEGEGARLVRELGVLMVYRKWVRPLAARPGPGELVVAEDEEGGLLGCGFYDTVGPVALRLVEVGRCSYSTAWEALVDRFEKALAARRAAGLAVEGGGYRLIHSDGDWVPGLIVDVYSDLAVYQSSSIVWDVHRDTVVEAIVEVTGAESVYEKSTQRTRREIGLEPREGLRYGSKARTVIAEGEARFVIDPRAGQKTGFFLDQRLNRLEFGRLASGRVLDLFAYTGGFGIQALVNGAEQAVFVEEDEKAAGLLRENLELNGVEGKARVIVANVWSFLRRARSRGERFDAVAVDPPAFIPHPAAKEKGLRGYESLFTQSTQLARRGGLVFLSSCSTHLSREEFQQLLARALARAGRSYTVLGSVRGMPPDHPARPGSPHLEYLKAVFIYAH